MVTRSIPFLLLLGNGLAIASAFLIYHFYGENPFEERGFITFLSTFQLLAVSLLSDKIFQIRRKRIESQKDNSVILWKVIAWGFIFLAADEFLSLHEVTDLFIHDFFDLEETSLTDRIDDLIVGIYGLVGIGVLIIYRRELVPFKSVFPFFKLGFLSLFMMIALDFITNDEKLFVFLSNQESAHTIRVWLSQLEEVFKVFGEAFFILAFYSIMKLSKAEPKGSDLQPSLLRITEYEDLRS